MVDPIANIYTGDCLGTLGVAAQRQNRRRVPVESVDEYAELARGRVELETGG